MAERVTREAIDQTARNHVDAMRQQGVNVDYQTLRDRIARAVERCDRKREERK
jgi:hypothetical protein